MRNTRLILACLLGAVLVPSVVEAQRAHEFEDSWFWGAKGGVSTFTPTFGETETAASYGGEWLITRRHAALYASVDQTELSTVSFIFDPSFEGSVRPVHLEKLRRVSVAALAFPKNFSGFRPYAGLGLAISVVGSALPEVGAGEQLVDATVWSRIDARSSQASLLLMGGGQFQVGKLGVFAQASVLPANKGFFLNDNPLGFFEAGVRYNFLGSRDRLR